MCSTAPVTGLSVAAWLQSTEKSFWLGNFSDIRDLSDHPWTSLQVIKHFLSYFFFLFLPFHFLPLGYESASASSACEPCKSNKSKHSEEVVHAKVFSKRNREQLEKIIKYSRSTEMSSGILSWMSAIILWTSLHKGPPYLVTSVLFESSVCITKNTVFLACGFCFLISKDAVNVSV